MYCCVKKLGTMSDFAVININNNDNISQVLWTSHNLPAMQDPGSIPGSGRSSGEGNAGLFSSYTPVFLPGESHGQRSLAGYSPQGRKSQTRLSD